MLSQSFDSFIGKAIANDNATGLVDGDTANLVAEAGRAAVPCRKIQPCGDGLHQAFPLGALCVNNDCHVYYLLDFW
jgi:hypothetical protein